MTQAKAPAQKMAAPAKAPAQKVVAPVVPEPVVPEPEVPEPEAPEPEARADKFKVKNTSKNVLTLVNGSIKPDGIGTITNAEYSYLYKRVEIA